LDGGFMHEDAAESFVEQFGTDALGIVVPIMRDRKENPSSRGRAAFVAGKYRDPELTQDIINVIEQTLQPNMGPSGLAGIAYAIEALGWAGDKRAMEALKTLAGDAFWEQREPTPYKLEPEDAPRIQRLLRQRAILALGRAPDGAGIDALQELPRDTGEVSDAIDESIADARLRRWGLAN
ncbi:MAG: hypothetical protein WD873_04150, partial [Candidatus Hydrogenedentales bacterium]